MMTKGLHIGVVSGALALGIADLGVINLWIGPQVFTEAAPTPKVVFTAPESAPEKTPLKEVQPEAQPPEPPRTVVAMESAKAPPPPEPKPEPLPPPAPKPLALKVDPPKQRSVKTDSAPSPESGDPPNPETDSPVGSLPFGFDADDVGEDALPRLERIAKRLAARPGDGIIVVGHTDAHGDSGYNEALSLRRANAVAAKLRELGVEDSRISVRGLGSTQPLRDAQGNPLVGPRNRRAEVFVSGGRP
jgi:OOP family OmpA-OmpF porin